MAGNPFYANARAKSAENYLLGADRFNRMLQADSAEDALKILREVNFGEGANAESALEFEALLRAEREKLNRFVREVSPSRAFRRFFLAESDYHNAEALIKAKHLKISAEPLLTAGGDIDPARMEEKIMADDYASFPPPMASALLYCDNAFVNGTATGARIGDAMKRALFADRKECSAKNGDLKALYSVMADTANLSSALRARNYACFLEMRVPGGRLTENEAKALSEDPLETLKEKLKYFYLSDFAFAAIDAAAEGKPLSAFEKLSDDALLLHFKKKRYDMSGCIPFMLYCYYKRAELTNLRIIMVGLINKLDRSEIQERLREAYEG